MDGTPAAPDNFSNDEVVGHVGCGILELEEFVVVVVGDGSTYFDKRERVWKWLRIVVECVRRAMLKENN